MIYVVYNKETGWSQEDWRMGTLHEATELILELLEEHEHTGFGIRREY